MSTNNAPPMCTRCCTNHWAHQACAWIKGEKRRRDTDIADPPVYGFTKENRTRT